MTNQDNNFDEDLPPIAQTPTLRRQNGAETDKELNREFIDMTTGQRVIGNPDLEHVSNKNLKEIIFWRNGQCKPNLFFKKDNDNDNDKSSGATLLNIGVIY